MGNLISLAKESKAFVQDIPKILAAFVEALFSVTKMLQDLEEIYIEIREISDLLELLKGTCKEDEQKILHEKATNLMKLTGNKLYTTAMQGSQLSEALKNVEVMIYTLLDTAKNDNIAESCRDQVR